MAEFTPITTQEEFNAAIGERLKRERETLGKKYADYDELKAKVSDYEQQIATLNQTITDSTKKYAGYDKTMADLQAKVKGYETASVKTRIARETGIPYELAERLSGETEEDIRKDAETLSRVLGRQKQQTAPLRSTEPAGNGKREALRALTAELTSKGD
ncbi:MAG: DUF4355 domain-containing protein [Oscillospiraceae bacterium]|nr:DUF4355 domain-containing protein [Oscillospiraceae bacterium]